MNVAEHEMEYILSRLRHAYQQLKAGTVKNQGGFADGLIAPVIRALEKEQGR